MTKRKLHRDQETAVVAGVLAGLADYFQQDPVLFRLAAIVLLVITGIFPGLIIYMIAWVIMPRRPKADYTVVE